MAESFLYAFMAWSLELNMSAVVAVNKKYLVP